MLKPLCALYAYQGRFADARTAITRSRAALTRLGAKLALAESAIPAALVALRRQPGRGGTLRKDGYQAFRAMGKGGLLMDGLAGQIAEALYAQGRSMRHGRPVKLGQARWTIRYDKRLTEAKLLARRSQFTEARQALSEVAASNSPIPSPLDQAYVLEATSRGGTARRKPRAGRGQPARRPADLRRPAGQQVWRSG